VVATGGAAAHGCQAPGALLTPGARRHRRTSTQLGRKRAGVGYDYLHVVVDDHSRLAYVELHRREDKHTNASTLERALAFFAELGLSPPQAVMTDNAKVYGSHRFQGVLAAAGARHITPPPYTPRWNGKAERFIQTLQNEWGRAPCYQNASERARALSSFMRYYNRRKPHSSLGDRPPISRVHNLHGQDT
jgi:transposase InsO family protein